MKSLLDRCRTSINKYSFAKHLILKLFPRLFLSENIRSFYEHNVMLFAVKKYLVFFSLFFWNVKSWKWTMTILFCEFYLFHKSLVIVFEKVAFWKFNFRFFHFIQSFLIKLVSIHFNNTRFYSMFILQNIFDFLWKPSFSWHWISPDSNKRNYSKLRFIWEMILFYKFNQLLAYII